jgi:NitT/TauT family transport system permease protein
MLSQSSRWHERNERIILGAAGMLMLIVLWEAGVRAGILREIVFSSPSGVVRALIASVPDPTFWANLGVSLLEFVLGFFLAAVVGIVLGFVAGWYRLGYYILDPWITILYSTPTIALIPMIILLLGIDIAAKVFVMFLIGVFPVIVNTMIGVQSVARTLLDVAVSFDASQRKQWTSVVFPGSLPSILTGLRLAGVHGMVGVVVAELLAGNEGIGFMLNHAAAFLHTDTVMLLVITLGTWGLFFGFVMQRIERRFEAWRP